MSKRQRHLKQRLDELFSTAEESEAVAADASAPPSPTPLDAEQAAPAAADRVRLLAVIEQLPLPAYVKDSEHTWVAVNAAYGELIGHAPAKLIGHTDKEQADEAWQLDDRVLDTGQPEETQETIPLPAGSSRTRHIKRTALFNDQHQVQYVLGVVHETTLSATPTAGQALPDNEDIQFKVAFENTVMSTAVLTTDGRFRRVNQAWCDLLGYTQKEMLGLTFRDITHPDDLDAILNFLHKMLADEIATFQTEKRYLHKNGAVVWVQLSSTLVRDDQHQPLYFISQIQDIAQRKHTEEELSKFKLGIDRANAAVTITDAQGTIVYVNPAYEKIYGYARAEVIGQNPRILKSGRISPEQYHRFWARLLAGEPVTGEIINKAKDGQLVPVETNNTPILDEHGKITGFLSIQYDISERKQAETELVEHNKQLTTLNRLGQELTRLVKPDEVLELVFSAIGEVFDNRNLYIALYDEHTQEITFPIYTIDGERRQVAGRPLGNGMTEYMLQTKTPLLIARDVQSYAASLGITNIGRPSCSYLGVPLLSGNKAIGAIAAQDYEHEEVYTPANMELLSTIATQTAAALENTRLHVAEERRALQLQTAAEVSSAASTVLDVDELLPFVVNLIQQRFNLYYVGLFFVNATYQSAVLRAATGEAGRNMLERGHQLPIDDQSMIGWCIGHETARTALDVGEDAVRFSNPDLPETHSELALPLISRGQVLGAMSVQSTEIAAFSPQDITVLQTMADQVATAIANAQLLEQSRAASQQAEARLREVQFLQAVGQAVSSTLDLTTVLDVIFQTLEQEMGFTHTALATLDKASSTITIVRASGTASGLQGLSRTVEQLQGDILLDILQKGETEVIDGWDDRLDRAIWEREGHAALVRAFVPLRLRREPIGILEVGYWRAERARITPDEVRLLNGMADQMAIAVGNARLFDDSQRRITELAVVNEISRTLTSTQDVNQLFVTIHQQVGRLFEASNFYIATYDGGDEWSLDYQFERNQLLPPAKHKLGRGFTGYILQTEQPLLIRSVQENAAFHEKHDLPKIGETAKSWMGVPLMVAGNITGVMGIQSYEHEGLYDEHNVALFSTIGTQAAAAIQNARLLQEARLRANELTALNELSRTLASQLSVHQVLEEVWHGVSRLLDTTNFYIALYDPERQEISFPINASESVLDQEITVMPASQGLTGYIIHTGQPLLIKENVQDTVNQLRLANIGADSQSYLGVPIAVGDQILGAVAIQSYTKSRLYNEHDQNLLMAIAGQTAIALQNARLFEQTQKQANEAAALNEIMQEISQRVDLEHVLDTAYRHISRLLPTDAFIVALLEGERRLYYPLIYDEGQRFPPRGGEAQPETHIGRVILTGQPLLVNRTTEELAAEVNGMAVGTLGNVQRPSASLLYVPLKSEQKTVGAISVQSYQYNAYTPDNVMLVERIANQLAIAIQNAQLFAQTQATLAETEQLYAASQRLTTATTLQEAVVTMVESVPLADINRAVLWSFERNKQNQVLTAIVSAGWYSGQGTPALPTGTRLSAEVIKAMNLILTTEPLFSDDLKTDPRIDPGTAALLQQQNIRAIAILPLWAAGHQIGAFLLEAEGPHTFTDAEIRPYISLSQQLATTIYNQQLLEQTRHNTQQLMILNELSRDLSQEIELNSVLNATYRHLQRLVPLDTYLVGLREENTDVITYPMVYDDGMLYTPTTGTLKNETAISQVLITGKPILKQLTAQQLAATTEVPGAMGDVNRPSASRLYVPLQIGPRTIGVLSVQSYQINAYTIEHVQIVGSVASQLAVAIQNARLFEQVQHTARREQTLRELTARVRSSTDPDTVMRTLARELGTVLGRSTFVRLAAEQPALTSATGGNGDQPKTEGGK